MLQFDSFDNVYMISHEFRTPLAVIASAVNLIEMHNKKGTLTDEELSSKLKMIARNCNGMTRLLNNILDLAGNDLSQIPFDVKKVNLVELIESLCNNSQEYIGDARIIFEPECDEIIAACDQIKIERMLLNLISNAVKYNKNEPEIIIKLKEDCYDATISVQDNGIGIPPDMQERVFELFVRVHEDMVRQGCGLGLAIVRKMAQLHGGSVKVESTVGKGSKFTIVLPKRQKVTPRICQRDLEAMYPDDSLYMIELGE